MYLLQPVIKFIVDYLTTQSLYESPQTDLRFFVPIMFSLVP